MAIEIYFSDIIDKCKLETQKFVDFWKPKVKQKKVAFEDYFYLKDPVNFN